MSHMSTSKMDKAILWTQDSQTDMELLWSYRQYIYTHMLGMLQPKYQSVTETQNLRKI